MERETLALSVSPTQGVRAEKFQFGEKYASSLCATSPSYFPDCPHICPAGYAAWAAGANVLPDSCAFIHQALRRCEPSASAHHRRQYRNKLSLQCHRHHDNGRRVAVDL